MFRSIFFFSTSFLLLFLGNLCAKNYYVSSASSGSADASNWTNKQLYSSFTWSKVAGGDTIYFDGGSSSVTYSPVEVINLKATSQVVITKGKDAGHNGEVIFSLTATGQGLSAFRLRGTRNVKLTGLTMSIDASGATNSSTVPNYAVDITHVYTDGEEDCYNNVVDNCHIKSNGWGSLMEIEGQVKDSITNNFFDLPYNTTRSEQDCIDVKWYSVGGHVIAGNTFKIIGSDQIDAAHHMELIQWWGSGQVTTKKNYETKILNNFFYYVSAGTCWGPGILMLSDVPGNRFLIANNVFVLKPIVASGTTQRMIEIGLDYPDPYSTDNISVRILNNTFVNGSNNGYMLEGIFIDTLVIKNNLFINDTTSFTNFYFPTNLSNITYKDIDYNIYYNKSLGSTSDFMKLGDYNRTLAQWQALGYDGHSSVGNVDFASLWAADVIAYRLLSGSAGIGAGTNLSAYFTTDIIGTPRPQGTAYDMGAFQNSTSTASATTFYVANNGNDANSGTSTSSPWKTISKVNSISFNPGDKILFRRGDTWSEILTPQGSGNASSPITYDAYGTGNLPIIDGGTTRNNCISLIGVNYINIRNFRVQYAAVNTTGNIHAQNTDHLRIENCDIYITSHGGVNVESSTNPYIGDNTMSSPVSNNDNQADGIYSQRNSNGIYEDNSIIISDMGAGHNDGIQSYLDAEMTFRNNYIYQNNSLTLAQGIDMSDGAGTFYVYNNVVKCPNSNSNIIGFNNNVSGTGAIRCYQNTVLGNVNCLRILKCADVTVKNNIFYTNSATSIIDIGTTLNSGSEIDYNLYNRSGSGSMVLYEPQGYMTFAQWQTAGYETHGLNANPIVNDTLCPAMNSPVINKGVNLGGIFSYDKVGTLRPANGVDLGAYELKSALPVELTSFTGNFINNSVHLTWSTATEVNNQGFDIEKNDNSSWVKIGFVDGKGTSVTKNNYSFEDKNPVGYTIKYRLKQIDNNGNFKYSDVISITAIPKDFSIGNYPNPFNPSTKIRYSVTSESMINLVIYNTIGERIDELKNEIQQPGTYETNWNGSGHASGIYFLSIIESPINGSAKNSKTIKMNLIK